MTTQPEFPNGALVVGAEIAFGADIDGDQGAWDWQGVTDVLMSQDATTTRGRQDESSNVSPTNADLTLDNPDGDLTPDNANSPYYPNVDVGTPARWWLEALNTRLYVPPRDISSAEIASSAALDLSGDLDIRIDMHLKTMDPSGAAVNIASRAESGGSYSWRVMVYPDRTVELSWTSTGTVPVLTARSTTPVVPMSSRSTLRVTLDVNNGAAGRTITFYVGDSVGGSFTQVGPAVVQAGTTSIANVGEPLVVGASIELATEQSPDMDVYAFQLLDGIGGSALVDANFTAYNGTPPFVDSTGNTWTLFGAAIELSARWFRTVGTIDEWAPSWPYGDLSSQQDGGLTEGESRVDIAIAGILRRLGQGAPSLESPLRRAINFHPAVRAYWPMEDEDGATSFAPGVAGGVPATFSGDIDLSSDSSLPGSKPLPVLTATSGISGSVTGGFGGHWQFGFYIHADVGPASPTTIMTITTAPGATATLWVINISAAAVTLTGFSSTNATVVTTTATPTGMFGGWTFINLDVLQSGTTVNVTLSWTPITYPASATSSLTANHAGVTRSVSGWSVAPAALLDGISLGHISVAATSGEDIAGDAANGYQGETAVERMARLCLEQGVYFRVIGDPATTEQVGIQQVATLLTLLDDAENVDGGILYEMPDAVGLIYRTRESMYNQPPNLVLDGLQSQFVNPLTPIRDDQKIRNSITVTRRGGSSFTAVDQASIDKSGIYFNDPTLNLLDDGQLQDAAGWLLHQGTVPGMRYPQITTNLGVAPEKIDDWLTVDQGAQVHAINLPPQAPVGTVKVVVEGYSEPISPVTWEATMNCSPASVWDVAVVDGDNVSDAYLLRLETDGSQLAEAIDATDTAFQVSVTDGPAWVTAASEFPFDINIGGERMTVTDIDATAGGEEFTGAGTGYTGADTVSHVAPSVVAPAIGDLLISAWISFDTTGTYTVPGSMTGGPTTSGAFSTLRAATQTLAAAGATGTRTATFSAADRYSALSVAIHAGTGSPTVVATNFGVSAYPDPLTMTVGPAEPGDWLLVINGWDDDAGNAMDGPDGGWISIADSVVASTATSRIRAWARRVTTAGVESVTLPIGGDVDDNHGRMYLLRGLTGPTQLFTVTRSVNGIVKSHALAAPVTLWNTPVLAR